MCLISIPAKTTLKSPADAAARILPVTFWREDQHDGLDAPIVGKGSLTIFAPVGASR